MAAIFPASTKGGGQCLAFPDVCKTPAPPAPFAPIPYPNIAMLNQSSGTASKVKFSGKDAFTSKSKVTRSSGDEAGTMKGMVSMKNMDKAVPKVVSSNVTACGGGCARLTSTFAQNGTSANMPAGCDILPSQIKVIVS